MSTILFQPWQSCRSCLSTRRLLSFLSRVFVSVSCHFYSHPLDALAIVIPSCERSTGTPFLNTSRAAGLLSFSFRCRRVRFLLKTTPIVDSVWVAPDEKLLCLPSKMALLPTLRTYSQKLVFLSLSGCNPLQPLPLDLILLELPQLQSLCVAGSLWKAAPLQRPHTRLSSLNMADARKLYAWDEIEVLIKCLPSLRALDVSGRDSSLPPLDPLFVLGHLNRNCPNLSYLVVDSQLTNVQLAGTQSFLNRRVIVFESAPGATSDSFSCFNFLNYGSWNPFLLIYPATSAFEAARLNSMVAGCRSLALPLLGDVHTRHLSIQELIDEGVAPHLPIFPADKSECERFLRFCPEDAMLRWAHHLGTSETYEIASLLCGRSAVALCAAQSDWSSFGLLITACNLSHLDLLMKDTVDLLLHLPHPKRRCWSAFATLRSLPLQSVDLLRLVLVSSDRVSECVDSKVDVVAQHLIKKLLSTGETLRNESSCRAPHPHPSNLWQSAGLPHLFYTNRIEIWTFLVGLGADLNAVDSNSTLRTLLHVRIVEHDLMRVYFLLNNQARVHKSIDVVRLLFNSMQCCENLSSGLDLLGLLITDGFRPWSKFDLEDVLVLKSMRLFETLLRQDWIALPAALAVGSLDRVLPTQTMVLIASSFNISDDYTLLLWSGLGLSRGFLTSTSPSHASHHSIALISDYCSILHVAAAVCWNKSTFRFLIRQCRLSINQRNCREETPFLVACKASNVEAVKALIYYKTKEISGDTSTKSFEKDERFPEHVESREAAKAALFGEKDCDGNSGLHLAVASLSYAIVEFLCSENFDIDSKNSTGKTPVDICIEAETCPTTVERSSSMYNLLSAHYKLQKGHLPASLQRDCSIS